MTPRSYTKCPSLQKIDAANGSLVLYKCFDSPLDWYYYRVHMGMRSDSSGYIYVAHYNYITPYNQFIFYKLDQNTNIILSKTSQPFGIYWSQIWSDMIVDSTRGILYVTFAQAQSGGQMIVYGISTTNFTTIYLYKLNNQNSNRLISTIRTDFYGNYLYIMTGVTYIVNSYQLLFLQRYDYNFDMSDTCDAMYKVAEYSNTLTAVGLIDYTSFMTTNKYYVAVTTNFVLEPMSKFYAELFNYVNPYQTWAFTVPPYCSISDIYFPAALSPQYVNISGGVQVVVIQHATSCKGYTLVPTLTVDYFSTFPSFITFTTNTTHLIISVDPGTSNTLAGLYTIRVKYTHSTIPSIYLIDTFELQVYPATQYGTTPSTCALNVWPLMFGGYGTINYTPYSGDIDPTGSNVLICGQLTSNTLTTIAQPGGFVIEKNINLQTHYMYAFSISTYFTQVFHCAYAEGSNYIAIVNGADTSNYQSRNEIYKFQSVSGYYVNGKQFANPATVSLMIESLSVSNITGDIYIGGYNLQSTLKFGDPASYYFGFVMKLDKNFNFQWYSTMYLYPAGGNQYFSAVALSPDYINGQYVYVGIQFFSYYGYLNPAYSSLDMNSGTILCQRWNDYPYFTMQNYRGIGIAASLDNTGVYFAAGDYRSGLYAQVDVMKFEKYSVSRTGAPTYEYSFQPFAYVVMAVDIMQDSNLKVILVGQTQYYQFFIRFSSTLSIETAAQIIQYDTQMIYYVGIIRLARDNNNVYYSFLYNPAWSISSNMFVTRFQSGATLSLKETCGGYYTINTGNQVGGPSYNYYVLSYFNALTYDYYGNYPMTSVQPYITNIQYSFIKYYDNSTAPEQLGYRGSQTSGCSSMAVPTAYYQPNISYSVSNYMGSFPITNPFQCQSYYYYTTANLNNGSALPTFIQYDNSSNEFNVNSASNSYVGNYSIVVKYIMPLNGWYTYSIFWINITYNHAPFMTPGYPTTSTIYANHNWTQTFTMKYDIELDLPYFTALIYSSTNGSALNPQPTWFVTDNTSVTDSIVISAVAPNNAYTGNYYIIILLMDDFNPTPTNNTIVNLTISHNYAPVKITPYVNTFASIIPWPFNYTLNTSVYNDSEGDQTLITCLVTTTATAQITAWAQYIYTQATQTLFFYGTPSANNAYAGIYTYNCTVQDQYDGTPNYYTFLLSVYPKNQTHIVSIIPNQYTRVPDNLTVYVNGTFYDDQNLPITVTILVNGTVLSSALSSWLTWNSTSLQLKVTPLCNCDGGNHTIIVKMDDGISTPTTVTFNLEVMQDWPLVYNTSYSVDNMGVVVMNSKQVFYNMTYLFTNPEGLPYVTYYALQGEMALKGFMHDLGGGYFSVVSTSFDDVGTYNVEIVGVDDAGWLTLVPFTVVIKPCYYTCTLCWDSDYNTCNQCIDNYFLLYASECVAQCVAGTYPAVINSYGKCIACPTGCATCTGNDPYSQCQTCSKGYYFLNNGCYSICPAPYWNNMTAYVCSPCNEACNNCYGPSSTQCKNCSETYATNGMGIIVKQGYLLQGTSCKIPKCTESQYFLWDSSLTQPEGVHYGNCQNCNNTCKTCVGSSGSQCQSCYLGLQLDHNQCLQCEQVTENGYTGGYFTNQQFACEDLCGDGRIMENSPNQCDDGNKINGDGCTSACKLEDGYACNENGTSTCRYTIQPTFSISKVTSLNAVSVSFSTVIKITQNFTLTTSNIVINVTGPLAPYTYTWRMTLDQDKPLLTGYNISQFQFIVENFEESLSGDGSELVIVSFNNYTQVYDIVHNLTLTQVPQQASLSAYTYISASAQSAIDGGGATLKYTLLSVFGFQLILKLILSSSMSYLWSFVNSLQIISILLYLNIDFPDNVISFVNYLQFSNSGIPELTNYIPDTSDYLIDKTAIELDYLYTELPSKFNEMGVEIFFLVSYGKTVTIQAGLIFIAIPCLLALNQLCSRVQLWEDLLGSFFFNGPLRTLITIYLSVVFQIVINTQYISFSNYSESVASVICMLVGYMFVYFPFGVMSLIYNNRRDLRKSTWTKTFGMLTDELKSKDILQLYYYPLFMYQRLCIASIIVFLQSYPAIQCFSVLLCNCVMIAYFLIIRPFKEENQQTLTVINEIIIMICICFYLVLIYVPDLTATNKTNLGWLIVAVIVLSAVGNFTVVIYFGAQKLQRKIRDMFGEEDYQDDSPNTSGNSDTLGSEEEEEEGQEKWRPKGMKTDQQLIHEIRVAKQPWSPSDKMEFSAGERGSEYENPYPTMINVSPLRKAEVMTPRSPMPGQMDT